MVAVPGNWRVSDVRGCERVFLCVIPLAEYFHDREAALGSVNVRLLGVALVCVWEHCEKLEQGKPFCNMILKLVWHMD